MTEEIRIDREKCCYCGGCVGVCPEDALILMGTELKVDTEKCSLCRNCLLFCPVEAIVIYPDERPPHQPEVDIIQTDVVIVGAGPAGSLCAKYLAQSGRDVLVVEKKQEIGVPKRCAEAVDFGVFEKVGVEPHPLWNSGNGSVMRSSRQFPTVISFSAYPKSSADIFSTTEAFSPV